MAAGMNFEIEGLEELERDLTAAVRAAPEKAKETLRDISKDFKKSAKKRANSELKPLRLCLPQSLLIRIFF